MNFYHIYIFHVIHNLCMGGLFGNFTTIFIEANLHLE